MIIEMESFSSRGGREKNEDSFYANKLGASHLAIVADGLGAYGGGEVASDMAVKMLPALLETFAPGKERVKLGIEEVNKGILAAQREGQSFKTTIAALWLDAHNLVMAHVGDSRIYQFRKNEIIWQSLDHSVTQMAVMLGEITPDQMRGHEERNRLTRCLGNMPSVTVDATQAPVQLGDSFLLCSDGFWELIIEEEMEASRRESQHAKGWLRRMSQLVRQRTTSTSDNQTAVVVQL